MPRCVRLAATCYPCPHVCGVFEFDVNDHGSIARAISAAGPIDALVSNAGAGLMGALEGVSLSVARVSFSG